MFRSQKNHNCHLQEGLKSHLAFTAFTSSGVTNPCRLIREHLKSHPLSNHYQNLGTQTYPNKQQVSGSYLTVFSLFINTSDIPDVTSLPTKASAIGYLLWRGYCYCLGIKNSISATCSLCKYTWKVVVCMVLTGKRRLGLNIWPKIPQ